MSILISNIKEHLHGDAVLWSVEHSKVSYLDCTGLKCFNRISLGFTWKEGCFSKSEWINVDQLETGTIIYNNVNGKILIDKTNEQFELLKTA